MCVCVCVLEEVCRWDRWARRDRVIRVGLGWTGPGGIGWGSIGSDMMGWGELGSVWSGWGGLGRYPLLVDPFRIGSRTPTEYSHMDTHSIACYYIVSHATTELPYFTFFSGGTLSKPTTVAESSTASSATSLTRPSSALFCPLCLRLGERCLTRAHD